MLLKDMGKLQEEEPLMRECLAIDRKALGAEHSSVADDFVNLKNLLKAMGRDEKAEASILDT